MSLPIFPAVGLSPGLAARKTHVSSPTRHFCRLRHYSQKSSHKDNGLRHQSETTAEQRSLARGNDINDPGSVRLTMLGREKVTVRLAVFVCALPVDYGISETRLDQQLEQLRHSPQPPLVRKRPVKFRTIRKPEVDVTFRMTGNGIIERLIPDICKVVVLGLFLLLLKRFVAAIGIDEKHTVLFQRRTRGFKVALEQRPFLEYPVAEVKCNEHIDGRRAHIEHIRIFQPDSFACCGLEFCNMIVPSPLQYVRVDIHRHRSIVAMCLNPFTGCRGGAAEIFEQCFWAPDPDI